MQSLIAGVDEVGRGPLAGSVIACAVILDPNYPIEGIKDSKKLSPAKREQLALLIQQHALAWALGRANIAEIDDINILQASLLAMQRAVLQLTLKPNQVLVDGTHVPLLPYPTTAIIKGDSSVEAIAAASIVAKVARDAEMMKLDEQYPQYGFAKHKGYPTAAHLAALQQHGISAVHRRSFAPVARLINKTAKETQ